MDPSAQALPTGSGLTLAVDRGALSPAALAAGRPGANALLIVSGLLMRELQLSDAVAADLLGPGDVVALRRSPDELLPASSRLHAVVPSSVAVLDSELEGRLLQNPRLAVGMFARSVQQGEHAALHRMILQLPHVEQRLLGLFWLIAERWGRVRVDGVVVPMRLTHKTLGRLAGARRPTVTLALKALAREKLLQRIDDDDWLLGHGSAASAFVPSGRPDATPLPRLGSSGGPDPDGIDLALGRSSQLQLELDALRLRARLGAEGNVSPDALGDLLERCRRIRDDSQAAREGRLRASRTPI